MAASNSTSSYDGLGILKHPAIFGFRTLFYGILPSESSFEKSSDVPEYIEHASPFFFSLIMLEIIVLKIEGNKFKLPRLNDAFSSLAAGLLSVIPQIATRHIEFAAYEWTFARYHIASLQLPWNSPWTWWLCFIGVDLGYYWFHRMAHEINIFWAAHQVHHSSEDYNLTTALRQSVLQKYTSWMFYLPMALIIPPSVFVVHLQLNILFQFWIHTEAVDRLGPLEYFLNTPSHHRVHHGRNRYCIDKNYAGVFIIWDRMFGTFAAEQREDKVVFGLTHPLNSWDVLYTQFLHVAHIGRMVWATPGLANKFFHIVKGPGWMPGLPRLGRIEDIPDVHHPQPRYNKSLNVVLSIYTWTHFFASLAMIMYAQNNRKDVPYLLLVLTSVFLIWTLTNLGYLYESKPYAAKLEALRCVVFLVGDALYLHQFVTSPTRHLIGRIFFSASLLLWLVSALSPSKPSAKQKSKAS